VAKQIGSQLRVSLAESGMRLVARKPFMVLLEYVDTGEREIWYARDYHAGYTIQVGRWGYEYGMDLREGMVF
jgi:hypothetical protein